MVGCDAIGPLSLAVQRGAKNGAVVRDRLPADWAVPVMLRLPQYFGHSECAGAASAAYAARRDANAANIIDCTVRRRSPAKRLGVHLLVTQGIDRIEPRGLVRGIEAEEDADHSRDAEREQNGVRRDLDGPLHHAPEELRPPDADADADHAADDGEG